MVSDADLDTAAKDPPLGWLTVAVAGLVLVATGVLAFVVDLLGQSGAILDLVPLLGPLFGLSPFVAIFGAALFVVAMTEWSPDLDT